MIAETARYLGVGVGNLVNLEKIVVGGWLGLLLGPRLLAPMVAHARRHALAPAFARTSVKLCRLGEDAVALGAATLVLEQVLVSVGSHRPTVHTGRL